MAEWYALAQMTLPLLSTMGTGLVAIYAIFKQAHEIANLSLNTDKGRIIPLGAKCLTKATE